MPKYLVGESGPELWVPKTAGFRIIPKPEQPEDSAD